MRDLFGSAAKFPCNVTNLYWSFFASCFAFNVFPFVSAIFVDKRACVDGTSSFGSN